MKNQNNSYDAIVIGSGIGGLSTAALLSKINKKRVLVLEKHYEIGGLTHEFKRGPYSWDVGLHYVGNMNKRLLDILGFYLFRYLTNDKLKWNAMPHTFEKFMFPELTFDVKSSLKEYRDELFKKFPNEKKSINRYLKDVHKVRMWYLLFFFGKFFHPPIAQIFKFITNITNKKALMKTSEYLDKYVKDEKLKALLTARWGNYGLPPTESSFAIHALVEHHYFMGGVFPEGGAEKIATYMEEVIESQNGKILISKDVTEIIVENGRAVGVKAKNLLSKEREIEHYFAPIIISSAGVQNTYLKLLPKDLTYPIQEELKKYYKGYSGLNVYLGLKESPEKLGIKGENYWICDSFDTNLFGSTSSTDSNSKPFYCFLSFPSMKSGKISASCADIVTIFPYEPFKKWEDTSWKERDNSYYEFKNKFIDDLLLLIEKYIPGFSELVAYKEISSPLTFKHFTDREYGSFYGLPSTPERFRLKGLEVKTPIKGLYLTGGDLLSNGIFPTLFSGMGTVSYINGPVGSLRVILSTLFYNPKKNIKNKDQQTKNSYEEKLIGKLVEKTIKYNNIIELKFNFKESLKFIPGQHVKLLVAHDEWRAYSIAKSDENNITLIIDKRPGGFGAKYAQNLKINDISIFRLPITDLIYHDSDKPIMFISTGTGVVPFFHMMDELKKSDIKKDIVFLFGCMNDSDNFIDDYMKEYEDFFNIDKIIVVENTKENSPYVKGRVTDILQSGKYDLQKYDYYLCGHPNMTQSVIKYLRNSGVESIYW